MAQSLEFTIPGTNTKVPVLLVGGFALIVAFILLARRGGGEDEGNAVGLLVSEMDQRLREFYRQVEDRLSQDKPVGEPKTDTDRKIIDIVPWIGDPKPIPPAPIDVVPWIGDPIPVPKPIPGPIGIVPWIGDPKSSMSTLAQSTVTYEPVSTSGIVTSSPSTPVGLLHEDKYFGPSVGASLFYSPPSKLVLPK